MDIQLIYLEKNPFSFLSMDRVFMVTKTESSRRQYKHRSCTVVSPLLPLLMSLPCVLPSSPSPPLHLSQLFCCKPLHRIPVHRRRDEGFVEWDGSWGEHLHWAWVKVHGVGAEHSPGSEERSRAGTLSFPNKHTHRPSHKPAPK